MWLCVTIVMQELYIIYLGRNGGKAMSGICVMIKPAEETSRVVPTIVKRDAETERTWYTFILLCPFLHSAFLNLKA